MLLGMVVVPVIAWAFRPEDVGRLALFQLALSLTLLFFTLGLDQAYIREFHESNDKYRLLKATFLPGFSLLLIAVFFAAWFSVPLSIWIFGEYDPLYGWLSLFCILSTYVSRYLSLILRMEERGLAFSLSQIIPKALQLVLLLGTILLGGPKTFSTLLVVWGIANFAVVLAYAWNTRQQWLLASGAALKVAEIRLLLKFGVPLMFSGLAYWGLTATSSLVLRSRSSFDELAIFSVVNSFASAASVFQVVFSIIWAPTVYRWVANGIEEARLDAIRRQGLAVACAIFILIGSFSWFVDYLLPEHYLNVKNLLLCAAIPPLLYVLADVTSIGVNITRRTGLTMGVTLAAFLLNMLLNLWLVPKHGAAGAVMANAIAYLIYFIGRTEAAAYVWCQFPRKKIYMFVGIGLIMALIAASGGHKFSAHYSLTMLILVPVLAWSFRVEWTEILAAAKLTKAS
ncbi:Membrane protein involved in the export of O-antigen and teichoic acid [Variovorax sp. PDC80]|nr:Membrane protein involved in the export of O-antigen and teichoic acid [Variovorax sp. PDC80]